MSLDQQTRVSNLPLGPEVRALVSNSHGLIALEKPVGVMSHPNSHGEHKRCLLVADYDYDEGVYIWKSGGSMHRAWLLNRLDSPTSGALLLGLNEEISAIVKQVFAAHKVQKTYYALVKRTPLPMNGCWKDILEKDAYRRAKVTRSGQKSFARTYYQVIRESEGTLPVSLLKLSPVTGRTHQLRIQCKYHQHPIVGDRTHGDFSFNRKVFAATGEKRMMLHSAQTALNYTLHGKQCAFSAESALPEAFARLTDSCPNQEK